MKKVIFFLSFLFIWAAASSQDLNGATVGFSFGSNFLGEQPYDYSLSPDSNRLVLQKMSKTNFVISTTLTIKFFDIAVKKDASGRSVMALSKETTPTKIKWYKKFSANIGINLAEVSSSNVSFNKQIDGGIGIGYFFNPTVQLAAFYDIVRIRQMRDYIVAQYEGKPIPNGNNNEFYNALDLTDNRLFYNKTFTGFSLKIIIALNPKKTPEN